MLALSCFVNTVILVGRAGQNPEIRYLDSGKILSFFNLAVDRPKTSPEAEGRTDWFKIEAWGRQASVAHEYIKKGSLIGIRGRVEIRLHAEHAVPEMVIHCVNLRLLGSRHDVVPPRSDVT